MMNKIVKSFFANMVKDDTSVPPSAFDALARENAKLAHELQARDELISRLVETAENTATVLEDLEEVAALSAESLREMVKELRETAGKRE
jgi:hypothetical protein